MFSKYLLEREKEYLSNCRPEFIELFESGQSITQLPERCNSYEWKLLFRHATDELFLDNLKYFISQEPEFTELSEYALGRSYSGEVCGYMLHELIRRFEKIKQEQSQCQTQLK